MLQSLFIVDMSIMVSMLVLANLSKRLGNALKIRPYYRVLYATTALVFAAFGMDTFRETLQYPVLSLISIAVRAAAGILGIVVCMPYWRWLFPEFLNTHR